MLSTLLLSMLGLELAVYALGGVLLWYYAGLAAAGILMFIPLIALALRLLVTLVSFGIAQVYRGQRPAEARIGPGGWLRLVFAEWSALLLLYCALQPFARRFVPVERPAPAEQTPVLLIHGFFCNSGFWWSLRRHLRARGIEPVYTLDLEPPFGDIERFAEQLRRRIEEICAGTGAERVILVAHSMGGLVARTYLRRWAKRSRVAKLITLGAPHHGTELARFASGADVVQMRPGSRWLRALAEGGREPVPVTSIYSWRDNIVAPQDSAELAGAKTIALAGIGHLEMAFSRRIRALVLAEIVSEPTATR